MLQKEFPTSTGGLALTWEAEHLYPASGRYRTDWRMDCARWEGSARHYRPDGTFWTVLTVHSYTPMRDLIKAKGFAISANGEVGPTSPNTEGQRAGTGPTGPQSSVADRGTQ
jgi:hypothetical protein